MTALAQGTAGLALVMASALLCIRQIRPAAMLLAIQSAAVAVAALVLQQPVMAIPPLLLAAGICFAARPAATTDPWTPPIGGAKLSVGAGAVLAILAQSQGSLALPLAVIMLSILLAATRRHAVMQALALVGLQNGIVLAACLTGFRPTEFLPLACLFLPLPLVASLIIPALTQRQDRAAAWAGWLDLGLALAVCAATLIVPLDSLASVFAPLLGLDGVLRAFQRRRRQAMSLPARGLALLTSLCLILAVCPPNPIIAWLAVLAAVMSSQLPVLTRSWDDAVLAFLGAGIALFGLLALSAAPWLLGYFCLFAGSLMIAAVVPDLAVVLVILLLRVANLAPWPPAAEALATCLALAALLVCAAMLLRPSRRPKLTLLLLSQAAIAALAIGAGQADGRFAALMLLVLLILTRSAARITVGPVAAVARAALGGLLPWGVFPGLVLVVLAITGHAAWLLLPLGAAAFPIVLASLPHRLPTWSRKAAIPSIGWLPLGLALLAGYATPDAFVRWCHMLTAGP
jgi:hypothetical protein